MAYEFVIMVPNVTPEEAVELAERLREQIARLGLCTVSIGVTVWDGDGDGHAIDVEGVLNAADTALLAAKQAGRNCVRAPEVSVEAA